MKHKRPVPIALNRVDKLLVPGRAKRGHAKRLRLSSRKKGRTVRPRQHANFTGDLTNILILPAVGPDFFVQNKFADFFFFDVMESLFDLGLGDFGALGDQRLHGLAGQHFQRFVPALFGLFLAVDPVNFLD